MSYTSRPCRFRPRYTERPDETNGHSPCPMLTLSAAMEDAHTAKLKLDESKSDHDADAFFAVFDGHGGTLHIRSAFVF